KSLIEASQRSVITNPNAWSNHYFLAGARQQGGAVENRRDFLFVLQYYILQENQAWMISHLQSLRELHN
ncbi:MAG: hypothetical protein WBW14_30470, partial [Candidatus Acidiferrum sp.]